MKIIVNSKIFANDIQRAFDVDAHVIQWYGNDGHLVFGTQKYQSDILHCTERQYGQSDTVKFNNLAMAKLLAFLKTLSEQPVTLTLEYETVRIEHSVVDFL